MPSTFASFTEADAKANANFSASLAAKNIGPGDPRYWTATNAFLAERYGVDKMVMASNQGKPFVGPIIFEANSVAYQLDRASNTAISHFRERLPADLEIGKEYKITHSGATMPAAEHIDGPSIERLNGNTDRQPVRQPQSVQGVPRGPTDEQLSKAHEHATEHLSRHKDQLLQVPGLAKKPPHVLDSAAYWRGIVEAKYPDGSSERTSALAKFDSLSKNDAFLTQLTKPANDSSIAEERAKFRRVALDHGNEC